MTDTLPVDEGMLKFYKELSKHSPPECASWPLPEQRKAWDDVCGMFRAPRPERLMVEDLDVDGVHVRVFRPPGESTEAGGDLFPWRRLGAGLLRNP